MSLKVSNIRQRLEGRRVAEIYSRSRNRLTTPAIASWTMIEQPWTYPESPTNNRDGTSETSF